jgi:alpha-tubulin suppressor-like RCC1 family protein
MKKILLNSLLLATLITNAQCWKTVSVGEQHSVGLQTNGTLWGWGFNGDIGRVGNGAISDVLSPTQISSATDWKEVYAAAAHTFAIKESGILWGWGSNSNGKLGTGTTTSSSTPIQIGTSTWKMVKASNNHSVGIKTDGTLWAWGDNEKATLGDGTFVDKLVPTLISSATNWKMVSCNLSRNIAVKDDGTLWVWGFNSPILGVTGMGSGTTHITVPTQVGTDTDWRVAVAGNGHFLALKNNNTLWAWGGGDNGQLGNNTTTSINFPTQIGVDNDWESVEADNQCSFGIKTNGTLYAWGQNIFGNLGNGTQINILQPTQITTSNDWKGVSTSVASTSALKTDGSLYSWGINYWGNLGNGTYVESFTPELINQCNLSTDSFDKNKLTLYPNPVQNHLFIDSEETQQYQIYSILGSKISEGTLAVGIGIDCSGLASGVYLLSLTNDAGNVSTAKFVKD